MRKINFEYTGVLYYYFTITKESSISNYEFKGLLDFVTGYLGIDKKYANRRDVEFYFEYDLATISSKFATIPYMWCGDLETKKINKNNSPENFYIGCNDLDKLKNDYQNFILTSDSQARKHLKEAVVAYLEYKKEIETQEIKNEINFLKEKKPKALIKNFLSKVKNK